MFWTAALAVVVDTSASPFIFDRPKSVILATNVFVLIRMFCGFKSQWAIRACKNEAFHTDFSWRNALSS